MFAPDAALEPYGLASRRSRRPSLASRVSLPDIFTKHQYKCIPSQGVLQIFSLKGGMREPLHRGDNALASLREPHCMCKAAGPLAKASCDA